MSLSIDIAAADSRGRAPESPSPGTLSIVIPCLEEAARLEACVLRTFDAMAQADLLGEVIVVDNGSIDGIGELARQAARGSCSNRYVASAMHIGRGDCVVMADADETYDFREILRFAACLRAGAGMERLAIFAATVRVVGIQIVFMSFLFSIIGFR